MLKNSTEMKLVTTTFNKQIDLLKNKLNIQLEVIDSLQKDRDFMILELEREKSCRKQVELDNYEALKYTILEKDEEIQRIQDRFEEMEALYNEKMVDLEKFDTELHSREVEILD